MYSPDRWVVVKVHDCYKVLGGWGGGYLASDEWKLNSGITEVTKDNDYFHFKGYSGSTYKCYKESYGCTTLSSNILDQLEQAGGVCMPEDTDWLTLDYSV